MQPLQRYPDINKGQGCSHEREEALGKAEQAGAAELRSGDSKCNWRPKPPYDQTEGNTCIATCRSQFSNSTMFQVPTRLHQMIKESMDPVVGLDFVEVRLSTRCSSFMCRNSWLCLTLPLIPIISAASVTVRFEIFWQKLVLQNCFRASG